MSPKGQMLWDYLHRQFPATVGHIPLAKMIDEVHSEGMTEAMAVLQDHKPHGGVDDWDDADRRTVYMCVARIRQARNNKQ